MSPPGMPMRALITGGSSGIGLAIAHRLLGEGATVVLVGRSPDRGAAALAELADPRAHFLCADASVPADCAALVSAAEGRLGGIDALFSCAGGDPMPRLLHDIPLDALIGEVTRSLAPTILPARAVLPGMTARGGGAIVMVASDAAKLPTPGESAIGAAMAGVVMFARTMAVEGARHGIRVNCLTPSIVEGTALHDRLMADPFAGKLFGKAKTRARLGVVQPDDLAGIAVFLAGPSGTRITGQAVSVTGGISAL
jgi:2-hydroxycyclohexanecarboxyl-CoA dehydrogenase